MDKTRLLDPQCAQTLGTRMQREVPALTARWQRQLEILKNNISIFVPVEERRQGLLQMILLLARCLESGDMNAFREKAMAVARLRAAQGFNLKDSLDEALTLEDLLFHWVSDSGGKEKTGVLEAIGIVHRVSHWIVQDISRVHVESMDRNMRQREQESFTDGLTHLFNYRFFKEFLQKEIFRSQRYQHPVSLVLMDVDFFKKLNDRLGHVGGDQILIGLARIAQTNCRITDLVCRYGGEEFAILLPETPKEQAVLYCERLRATIEKNIFQVRHAVEDIHLTVSVGMANYPDDAQDSMELIRKADQAMYMAKHGGRNRVCFYSGDGALRTA